MSVHFIHDLGEENLIAPYAAARVVCGLELSEAHEVVRPGADSEICADCLSWLKRNKFQNVRSAVEMSAVASEQAAAVGG